MVLKADGGLFATKNYGDLSSWPVVSIADLNGDGINDVLLKHISDGRMYSMLIDGNGDRTGYSFIGTLDPQIWSVEAVANFNDDSIADIMIKNTSGTRMNVLLNNNGSVGSLTDLGTIDSLWHTSYVGDYNGDGIMDVQIQYGTSGNTYSLIMNSDGTRNRYAYVTTFTPSSFTQYVPSNHNNDATSDLLSRAITGEIATWVMDTNASPTFKQLDTPALDWVIKNK